MAATTIGRTARTDGSSGTILDNAEKTTLYNEIDALFTSAFTFGDLVHSDGIGTHSWSGGGSGGNILNLVNTTGGTGNFSAVHLGRDSDADAGRLEAYSTSFTPSGAAKASGVALRSIGAGGLSLAAEDSSGDVRLYANGTTKIATFDGDGIAFEGGSLGTWRTAGVPNGSVNTTKVGTDANTTEKDLHTYTLPGGSLGTDGQMIRYTVYGRTGANTDAKRCRIYFGSTLVHDTGADTMNDGHWKAVMTIIRTGATTQEGFVDIRSKVNSGASWSGTEVNLSISETLASDVVIKMSGENSANTADDVTAEGSFVEFLG